MKNRKTRRRTKHEISEIMRKIKSKGSKIEVVLGSYLWGIGLRYRKHYSIVGKPDFAFPKNKIAVFCDSEFWHGQNWKDRKRDFKSRKRYWHDKIERNIKRDTYVNAALRKDGWHILRFWGNAILTNPRSCAEKVKQLEHKLTKPSKQ